MIKISVILFFVALMLWNCSGNGDLSDAYGNFESEETIISSEAAGKLLNFDIEEGMELDSGKFIGLIDTLQNYLKLEQLLASKAAVSTKTSAVLAQIQVLNQQKENLHKDKARIDKMFSDKAATQKQVDDINGGISVIDRQIEQIETQNSTILNELRSLDAQVSQIRDLISKSKIINPLKGTVLNKYVEKFEIVSPGKPLYKIANLSDIILRVYVTGSQLPKIKIGQELRVLVDKDAKSMRELKGRITWISSQAEFTPKIIQTKEERKNMVYAVKVVIKNDGSLKIGMPGEVRF
jgi:HlyD family secretion protein